MKNTLNLLCDSEISIPEELHHYIEDFDENNVTYHSKQPASEKLETAFRDACAVRDLIPSDLQDSEEAQLLNRFISEQIIIDDDGSYKAVRDGKELTSTALNNPAEPESTIRRKAGEIHQGFVGNFAESVDMETNRKIIDSADLQPNIYSDSQFAKDEIKKMAAKGDTSTLTADGAYAGVDNVNLAAENGIELTVQLSLERKHQIWQLNLKSTKKNRQWSVHMEKQPIVLPTAKRLTPGKLHSLKRSTARIARIINLENAL